MAWREGPAIALLIRSKRGGRATVEHPDRDPLPDPVLRTPADVAAEYATNERIERTADDLTAAEVTPTADAIRTRLVADLARERYADPRGPAGPVTATQAFQPTVATHVQRYLGELRCRTG